MKNTPNVTYREDGCILIKNVRLSYPHLYHPWAKDEFDENGRPSVKKFTGTGIMPIATHREDILGLKRFIEEMAVTSFKQKLSPERYGLRDGNLMGKEEYAKSWYIVGSQTADRKVNVVDRNPKVAIAEESNRVYAGCWVNLLVRPWAQNNTKGGKRINFNLLTVQFVKDDDSFGEGAGPAPEEAMDDISGDFPDEISGETLEGDGLGLDDDDEIPF